MKTVSLNFRTLGFLVATRAALGVGIGLLLSERLPVAQRRAIGMTLLGFGVATTIPAVMGVLRGTRPSPELTRMA